MKHLIVINPKSGFVIKNYSSITSKITKAFAGLDYEIYETVSPKDLTTYLKKHLPKEKEPIRLYVCGGDGTIQEAISGVIGNPNVELAIFPCGTGNDFVKIYGATNETIDEFRNFESLIKGKAIPIDVSKIDGPSLEEPLYSLNVINFGFDAIVGAKGNENKLKGKTNPYGFKNAILPAILRGRFNKIIVSADGKQLNKKKLLLCSLAQGQWVGGEYHASPNSDNTDGLIDVVILKTMTLFGLLLKMFNKYKAGQHLSNPKLRKKIIYAKAKSIKIEATKDIDICVDGEIIKGQTFNVDIIPHGIKIIPPAKL